MTHGAWLSGGVGKLAPLWDVTSRRNLTAAGFSLIEVTLAIGIVAFAFTAILGLLPIGLGSARNAVDTSIGSQIIQRIRADVRQTDTQLLSVSTASFDDQGNEVTDAARKLYDAKITLSPATLPGANALPPHLIQATIEIANNPGRAADPFSATHHGNRIYSMLLAGTLP